MSYFRTRKAAWTAMILMDHLKMHGIIQLAADRDGSVKFYAKGVWANLSWDGHKLVLTPYLKQIPVQKQAEVRIPGSAQQFEGRGDRWNACNIQHDAHNPDTAIRQNAFGDVCQKPTLEGFDSYGVLNHDRKAHRRLVLVERRTRGDIVEARKFANIRQRFQSGKV